MNIVYLNGRFVSEDRASVSISDRGLLYGEGLFETLLSVRGRILFLREHLDRLWDSAGTLGIPIPAERSSCETALTELLRRNRLSEAYLRMTVTGGNSPGLAPKDPGSATIFAVARQLQPYPSGLYEAGARLTLSKIRLGPMASHKTLCYLPNIAARRSAQERGADEAIMLDSEYRPAECSASNIFSVKDSVISTPPLYAGILPGIVRAAVIEICRSNNMLLNERSFSLDDLLSSDEVFVTNSLMGIMPVGFIDDTAIQVPGKITQSIAECYRNSYLAP